MRQCWCAMLTKRETSETPSGSSRHSRNPLSEESGTEETLVSGPAQSESAATGTQTSVSG